MYADTDIDYFTIARKWNEAKARFLNIIETTVGGGWREQVYIDIAWQELHDLAGRYSNIIPPGAYPSKPPKVRPKPVVPVSK